MYNEPTLPFMVKCCSFSVSQSLHCGVFKVDATSAQISEKCILKLLDKDPGPRHLRFQKGMGVVPFLRVYVHPLVRVRGPMCGHCCMCVCLWLCAPLLFQNDVGMSEDCNLYQHN